MKKKSVDLLLVGQTPPPFHGQAVVTGMLFDHDWSGMQVSYLRMSYSHSIGEVGHFSLGKVSHLFSLIFRTWWIAIKQRPKILYYLPASPRKVPIIRDIIYLGLTRWLFPKTVFHFHAGGLPEFLETQGLLGRIAQRVYTKPDVCIEICETDLSPSESFHSKRRVIVPNGIDVELVPRFRPQQAKLIVLSVGALTEQKGMLGLIEAARLLQQRGVNVEFQCVGGWACDLFKEEVIATIQKYGLEGTITFVGVLKGEDKWAAYSNADLFILPSHYESENFPIVLIEALAFGLPVVSTRWRGIPQLLGGDGAAILCDIKSPAQYADAIENLSKDIALRTKMSELAKSRYKEKFTREQFLSSMDKVFREVLKS